MTLKTYQAYTMAEALTAVKGDLGADAVILNTRTFRRPQWLGLWRRTIVEVTATPAGEHQTDKRPTEAPKLRMKAAAAQKAYGRTALRTPGTMQRITSEPSAASTDDRERTRRLAQALAETHKRSKTVRPVPAEGGSVGDGSHPSPAPQVAVAVLEAKPQARAAPPSPAANAARRFLLTTPKGRDGSDRPGTQAPGPAVAVTRAMEVELSAIKTMVGQVLHRHALANGPASPTLPRALFEMYLQLIGQELSDELADGIINDVRAELSPEDLGNEQTVRRSVLRHLAKIIPVPPEAIARRTDDGRPLTIALIGPTGVGKTTTLAKLAASFKLRHDRKVGLITCDTYRIAAVDQLRTYANIIGLPLQVAMTADEMKQATAALREMDVILIDTAGRGQKDTGRLDELRQFVAAANPHEVHLVLSSTAGEKVLLSEAQAFAEIGVHKIMLTKLDEAVSFGMLVNVIRRVGKQLSFVTTGQEVPAHLEVGRAERLAELVLGGAVHS